MRSDVRYLLIVKMNGLSDDDILNICDILDTPDLLNLSETSSRIYQICFNAVQKRKKSYDSTLAKKIRNTVSSISKGPTRFSTKILGNRVFIEIRPTSTEQYEDRKST